MTFVVDVANLDFLSPKYRQFLWTIVDSSFIVKLIPFSNLTNQIKYFFGLLAINYRILMWGKMLYESWTPGFQNPMYFSKSQKYIKRNDGVPPPQVDNFRVVTFFSGAYKWPMTLFCFLSNYMPESVSCLNCASGQQNCKYFSDKILKIIKNCKKNENKMFLKNI